MQDKLGYRYGDPWYITDEELKKDPRLKTELRKIHSDKISKVQVAILGVLGIVITGISAFIIRHYEYKYIEKSPECNISLLVNEVNYLKDQNILLQKTINSIKTQQDRSVFYIRQLWASDELKRKSKRDKIQELIKRNK